MPKNFEPLPKSFNPMKPAPVATVNAPSNLPRSVPEKSPEKIFFIPSTIDSLATLKAFSIPSQSTLQLNLPSVIKPSNPFTISSKNPFAPVAIPSCILANLSAKDVNLPTLRSTDSAISALDFFLFLSFST